jgi:hypothetical protein
MDSPNTYNCHYCNRHFSCKTALNKHKFGSCIWLHSHKKEKLNEFDQFEPLMSDAQRDMMLRQLMLQMKKMNEKIANQQKEILYLKQKQKISILQWLNDASQNQPTNSFQRWTKELVLTQRHLELVFQKSLKEGILQLLLDELDAMKIFHSVTPIRAYVQRPKTLYIYGDDPEASSGKKWIKLDNALLKKMCNNLQSRFYEMYMHWRAENAEYIHSSSDAQEQDLSFMQKMFDEGYKTNLSLGYITEQIQSSIQTTFQTMEYE